MSLLILVLIFVPAVRSNPRTAVAETIDNATGTCFNIASPPPVWNLKQRGILETTLRHELVHVVVDAVENKLWQRVAQRSYDVVPPHGEAISK